MTTLLISVLGVIFSTFADWRKDTGRSFCVILGTRDPRRSATIRSFKTTFSVHQRYGCRDARLV